MAKVARSATEPVSADAGGDEASWALLQQMFDEVLERARAFLARPGRGGGGGEMPTSQTFCLYLSQVEPVVLRAVFEDECGRDLGVAIERVLQLTRDDHQSDGSADGGWSLERFCEEHGVGVHHAPLLRSLGLETREALVAVERDAVEALGLPVGAAARCDRARESVARACARVISPSAPLSLASSQAVQRDQVSFVGPRRELRTRGSRGSADARDRRAFRADRAPNHPPFGARALDDGR